MRFEFQIMLEVDSVLIFVCTRMDIASFFDFSVTEALESIKQQISRCGGKPMVGVMQILKASKSLKVSLTDSRSG